MNQLALHLKHTEALVTVHCVFEKSVYIRLYFVIFLPEHQCPHLSKQPYYKSISIYYNAILTCSCFAHRYGVYFDQRRGSKWARWIDLILQNAACVYIFGETGPISNVAMKNNCYTMLHGDWAELHSLLSRVFLLTVSGMKVRDTV